MLMSILYNILRNGITKTTWEPSCCVVLHIMHSNESMLGDKCASELHLFAVYRCEMLSLLRYSKFLLDCLKVNIAAWEES